MMLQHKHSLLVVLSTLLLLATALAREAPKSDVQKMAATHTGSAAGVVRAMTNKTMGKETKIGGLDAYVATPAKAPTGAVLVITDIFGYKTDNIRQWADRLAAAGYLAVVPDYFKGNPRKTTDDRSTFAAWLEKFPQEFVLKEANDVLADIKKQYPSVKKIGVQGFCWGGLYSVLLAGGKSNTPLAAAMVYHGSRLTAAQVEAVTIPINFQQSDPALDVNLDTKLYNQIEPILAKKKAAGLDASITNYPKQLHGFSLRGNSNDTAVATAANTAFDAGKAFLDKHLAA